MNHNMNSNKCDAQISEISDVIGTDDCNYDKSNSLTNIYDDDEEEEDDHQAHHQQQQQQQEDSETDQTLDDQYETDDEFSQMMDEYLQQQIDMELQKQLDQQIQAEEKQITERMEAMFRQHVEGAIERDLRLVLTNDSHHGTGTDTDGLGMYHTTASYCDLDQSDRIGRHRRDDSDDVHDLIRLLNTNTLSDATTTEMSVKGRQERSTSVQEIDDSINVIINRHRHSNGS